jgi:2-(1,2-epoxy-1,2-dihydrophenyl)acetyl-CoA isomerase
MSEPCLIEVDHAIATITLNRPERLNAINADMHAGLRDALERIENDASVRVVVITGAGKGFCAGQDLAERATMLEDGDVDLAASLEDNYNPLVRRLVALPVPVIAAVNGVAAGAGAALALLCDVVVAARSASFQLAFARVALGPDSGTSWLFPRLIGRARALGMALTAESIDAERAESWGMIWRCVDDEALQSEAGKLARRFASSSRASLQTIKERFREAADTSLGQALDAERDAQGLLGEARDYREAVTAFMAKRKPKFD